MPGEQVRGAEESGLILSGVGCLGRISEGGDPVSKALHPDPSGKISAAGCVSPSSHAEVPTLRASGWDLIWKWGHCRYNH